MLQGLQPTMGLGVSLWPQGETGRNRAVAGPSLDGGEGRVKAGAAAPPRWGTAPRASARERMQRHAAFLVGLRAGSGGVAGHCISSFCCCLWLGSLGEPAADVWMLGVFRRVR